LARAAKSLPGFGLRGDVGGLLLQLLNLGVGHADGLEQNLRDVCAVFGFVAGQIWL